MTTPYVRASACGAYIVAAFGSAYPIVMPIDEAKATATLYREGAIKAAAEGKDASRQLEMSMAEMIDGAVHDADSFRADRIRRAAAPKPLRKS